MKKILFINHDESRTGAPKILFEIAKHAKKRFDVYIISRTKGKMHNDFNNEFKNLIYPSKNVDIIKLILKVNPNLVYVNSLVCIDYAISAKFLGIPTILHVHELQLSIRALKWSDRLIKNFHKYADLFIAVSLKVRDFLINDLNCLPEKIELVYEFISSTETLEKSTLLHNRYIKNEMNIHKNDKILISIGSAEEEIQIFRKGVDIAIDALNVIKSKGFNNVKYYWIGPYKNCLLQKCCNGYKHQNDNFIFLGEKENPFPYLKQADIFILPSREDPFPLVCLEAMALGKPIIAFRDGGGIKEAIRNDCGELVNDMNFHSLSESIIKLLNNENKISRYSKNGPIIQKQLFDTDVSISKTTSIIDKYSNELYKSNSLRYRVSRNLVRIGLMKYINKLSRKINYN